MPNARELSITTVKENTLFRAFLFFYPKQYRKRFGEQIFVVFEDMYQEELEKNGRIGINFWIMQFADLSKSIIEQHFDFLDKYGFKKYMRDVLHFNKYNALGILFLLPFISVFLLDIVSRIFQGNLLRPNTLMLHGLYNSPLYWFPILFVWVFLFPVVAVFLNIIPLIKSCLKNRKHILSLTFLNMNFGTLMILFIALSAVACLYLHDFLPCVMTSVLSQGIVKIWHILSVCRNA